MLRRYLAALLICFAVLASCEGAFYDDEPANDAVTVFETLWTRTNEVYPYFELKSVNWDSAYRVFRPRVSNGMSSRALFRVCSDMMYLLRDGHVNIVAPFDRSRNWEWFLGYPANFDFNVIERNYLDTARNYRITSSIRSGILVRRGKRIGYLYCGAMSSGTPNGDIDNTLVDMIQQGATSVIFDVRDNGGGRADMAEIFAARFATSTFSGGTIQYKTGPGKDNYGPQIPLTVNPAGVQFAKPVYVLTNRSVYSAANYFVQLMSQLPSVRVLGDSTGGGGGLPSSYDLPNGWTFRVSASRSHLPNGTDVELGIAPRTRVNITPSDRTLGKDTILEAALDSLDN
jgi:hypothetical protein